jgi:hypothetical protein
MEPGDAISRPVCMILVNIMPCPAGMWPRRSPGSLPSAFELSAVNCWASATSRASGSLNVMETSFALMLARHAALEAEAAEWNRRYARAVKPS